VTDLDKLISLNSRKPIVRMLCCPECGDAGPLGGRLAGVHHEHVIYTCNGCGAEFPSLKAMGSVEVK
jgi:hypothetical protein